MGTDVTTGASFQTHTFGTKVFTNATHAKFEIVLSMKLAELGWIAIGHGTRMSNSRMMIMWPAVDATENEKWILSYRSATGHIIPKSIQVPEIETPLEILQLTAFNHSNVAFSFTRPLLITASDRLQRKPGQAFVWAISSSRPSEDNPKGSLLYHDLGYGTVTLNLGQQILPDGTIKPETNSLQDLTHSYRHDGLITVHATVLSLAWIICAPAAILSARFMRSRSSEWIRVHLILHTLTVLLTLIGVICASVAVGAGSHFDSHQKKMGFMVVIAMLFQVVEGYAIHAYANKFRPCRPLQNWLHILFGCSLVLLSWFTVIFGIKEWEMQGRGTPIAVTVIMGLTIGIALFLYFLGLFRTWKGQENCESESCGIQSMVGISKPKTPERFDVSLDKVH
ncbi:hypothetical protein CROQUDRAFT_47839 [Cronartium quercuum f. sp. fusiforme G11]|uniref:Cytochrome b561 domain-containing protein n=1 Tax=Cronartium quercuum f. sp. fusiforme G11 TaxID=708437 RepID=A0A9P6NEE1_9BASI|nr:hypothetical protein CROQUDRAFT_47839 [Cronartium quercuum f. sp. fusiforme G11]